MSATVQPKEKSASFVPMVLSRARGDSPFAQLLIHLFLILACVVAVYPLVRILTLSLGPISKSFVDHSPSSPKMLRRSTISSCSGTRILCSGCSTAWLLRSRYRSSVWRCLPRARMPFRVGSFLAVPRRWCSSSPRSYSSRHVADPDLPDAGSPGL